MTSGRLGARAVMGRLRSVLAVVLVVSAVAGCAPAASPSPVATTSVDLPKSYRFSPEVITVASGSTVTWTNNDNFTHNVTFTGEPALMMAPGEQATREFATAGTYAYLCSLHPNDMQGTVIVTGG
jgi:plastocyanin